MDGGHTFECHDLAPPCASAAGEPGAVDRLG